MSGHVRRNASISEQQALGQGRASVDASQDNSLMQNLLGLYGAPGSVLNDHEDAGFLQSVASDLRSVAGFANAAGQAQMPGMGPITTAFGMMNTSRALDSIHDDGLDLDNGFKLVNGLVGSVGPWLPGIGPALAASWGLGTTVGKHLDASSEAAAAYMAGEGGDSRGLSDRLADRGVRVNTFLDGALSNVMSEENADLAGDVLGGVFTAGQVLTPAFHYDVVDSFTGGGLSDLTDRAAGGVADAWDWAMG